MMICPKCGNNLKDTAKFCGKCGTKVVAAAPVAPEATEAPAPVNPAPKPSIYIPPKEIFNQNALEPTETSSSRPLIIAGAVALFIVLATVTAVLVYLKTHPKIEDFLNETVQYGKIIDSRDNQKYYTVKIGAQEWLAQNVNYDISSSFCDTCSLYGRLYTYEDAQNACPEGWVLPSYSDVQNVLGKYSAKMLFSAKQGGMNDIGFSALRRGFYSHTNATIRRRGEMMGFWLRDETGDFAMRAKLESDSDAIETSALKKGFGFNVRCISKATTTYNENDKLLIDNHDAQIYKTVIIGGKRWMAENMRRKTRASLCGYDDSVSCATYGRLYKFDLANRICPEGWRLPDSLDINSLDKFKWHDLNVKTALKKTYDDFGNIAAYWTSAERNQKKGVYWNFSGSFKLDVWAKDSALLVRCVELTEEELDDIRAEQERVEIEEADRAALAEASSTEGEDSEESGSLDANLQQVEEDIAEPVRKTEEERAERERREAEEQSRAYLESLAAEATRDRESEEAEEEESTSQSVTGIVKVAAERAIDVSYGGYADIFTAADVNAFLKKNKSQIQSTYQQLLDSRSPFETIIRFRLTVRLINGKITDVEDISDDASMSDNGHAVLFKQMAVMMKMRWKMLPQDVDGEAYVEFPLKFVTE